MPHLDGLGLVEQARAAGFNGRIIVFTVSMTEGDRERYERLGVDAIPSKPNVVSLADLIRHFTASPP